MDLEFDFESAIVRTRENYGEAALKRSFLERRHWRVKPPSWARKLKDRRFEEQYRSQPCFCERGSIVWASIVVANNELYTSGSDDHPAMLLYGMDPHFDGRPDILLQAADTLFEIKGTRSEPDLQSIADRLADEMAVDLRLEVPRRITRDRRCYLATLMIHRVHLPAKRLRGPLMPLVVCPDETEASMVLPRRYWDGSFARQRWAEF